MVVGVGAREEARWRRPWRKDSRRPPRARAELVPNHVVIPGQNGSRFRNVRKYRFVHSVQNNEQTTAILTVKAALMLLD